MPGRLVVSKLAKSHSSYTGAELLELYGCSRGTLSNWIKAGLRPIDEKRPLLFHGQALNAFHATRREQGKRPCNPGEIYCFSCKARRRPAEGLIEYEPIDGPVREVRALCPEGHLMRQRVNEARLAGFYLPPTQEAGAATHNGGGESQPHLGIAVNNSSVAKLNAENERIKHGYRSFLKHAKQLDDKSIDEILAAIHRFEDYTDYSSFRRFRPDKATSFKAALFKQKNRRTGRTLSVSTVVAVLASLKAFFFWLAGQPGYKSRLRYDWTEYFNPSLKDLAVAKARRGRPVPTLDQIHKVIDSMPCKTPVEKRNRALLAFTVLTGSRDRATSSLLLKHVDVVERVVHFDAREVSTKFSRTFDTWFFPVGGHAQSVFEEWVDFLQQELGFGPDDPLFPASKTGFDAAGQPLTPSLRRDRWASGGPIRAIFKEGFRSANMPYFNPHSFRNTLARLGTVVCRTPQELKAWSKTWVMKMS